VLASSALPLSSLWAGTSVVANGPQTLAGRQFDLAIGNQRVNFTGTERVATTVNGSLPGPVLRWKEGERVALRVTNNLPDHSSIHWHGIILPSEMDGVPGMSFHGIAPGETFIYEFDVRQSGTYWYHSHSGFQEQTGLKGAIVIEPQEADPVAYDRDMVVMLSDWTDTPPDQVYATLKKMSDYYNFRERTVGDLWHDIREKGLAATWNERAMWNQMRMSDTDISDVTGYTYTYLMNGVTPDRGWNAVCNPGEKLRLRFINGSAMTIFDVRIPGLKMTVVAADGQNIQPVDVDEFRIGVAETYDVIVQLQPDSAHTVFAQSIDRTGYARGTLSTNGALRAEVPAMDRSPVLGHSEMGVSGMDHSSDDMSDMDMSGMDHSAHDTANRAATEQSAVMSLAKAGFGSNFAPLPAISHADTEFGPQVDNRSAAPPSGLADPGIGLRDHQQLYGRRVLRYSDIRALHPTRDKREPSREIELHLTGNMRRYMWSFNGIAFADAEPIELAFGERLRIVLINDSMMTHPIHLHGMWSELETGDPDFIPRKHTILVQPGSRISYLVTADAKGRWAYHCHLLYHMPGMMREVRVV
jgi:CopA family copper-resistance protein